MTNSAYNLLQDDCGFRKCKLSPKGLGKSCLKQLRGALTPLVGFLMSLDTLEPGEYRRIWLSSIGDAPWRVCVTYQPERRGLNAWLVCAKTAWATRRLCKSVWRGRVFSGVEQAVSREIP